MSLPDRPLLFPTAGRCHGRFSTPPILTTDRGTSPESGSLQRYHGPHQGPLPAASCARRYRIQGGFRVTLSASPSNSPSSPRDMTAKVTNSGCQTSPPASPRKYAITCSRAGIAAATECSQENGPAAHMVTPP